MRNLLKRGLASLAYSNLTLKFSSQQQAAFLTLSNEKKRNPLSLETIKELQTAFKEVNDKIHT
jgi:enoyl-CoA hydratase/carnithine racemase